MMSKHSRVRTCDADCRNAQSDSVPHLARFDWTGARLPLFTLALAAHAGCRYVLKQLSRTSERRGQPSVKNPQACSSQVDNLS
ncbi:hypothetical protein ALO59_101582 [Pseudomonas amygdali pv. mellea]|uniref:Uncharacterized protein n=6 Tax=Pseudomonas syringae group genomosp. 2 TaxID=251698 RepID=A0A3M5FL02_PSESS|nr:hypothetical protein ALO90_101749 [Pseudomonas amygdali pv. aesculi]KPW27942.1 hypothetical protein ALO51_101582 [Pseudomonas amygdali]KPW67447.1 hypothetical protein ALO82_101631 [Pseudomonas syringae pv. broussonetiae]KPW68110.1 hypothetical protein ALO78_101461 [Pseudomonas amygdali pv. ciccaronei]KPX16149.1 hypothetical protein ALO71_101624 [Pseudomonas amygdali pv. dendropanacis]KPX32888.1 hypothetical protein ALO70_101652 [Pseudomonas amygdali pv. eriobotryae]KPX83580.1 hypothetical 